VWFLDESVVFRYYLFVSCLSFSLVLLGNQLSGGGLLGASCLCSFLVLVLGFGNGISHVICFQIDLTLWQCPKGLAIDFPGRFSSSVPLEFPDFLLFPSETF
jgi:hypothetical protein